MRAIVAILAAGLAWAAACGASAAPAHPLTRADLEPWLDGLMSYHLAQNGMAGGEAVVVKDGQIVFAQGYGLADVASRRPVDVDATLFRPGSIAKTFTWTAVMQQVEQGRLDLDADVNRYLDFRLPHPQGRPITMRMLMTHSAGFEERLKGAMAPDVKSLRPLGAYLRASIPHQLFVPGTTPAYSNWGVTLAGYIVERVSGESFDDYMDRHVLGPLGMTQSTFRVPPPTALSAHLSSAYLMSDGPAQPFELDQLRPAGSLSATGPDMAHFMIAHLEGGRYGSAQVLRPETVALMHEQGFSAIAPLRGMSLGFFRADRDGHRILEHSGNSQFFFAQMTLVTDAHAGIYLAFNSAGRRDPLEITRQISEDFVDRYFPAGPAPPREPTLATARQDARAMAGLYESSRRVESGFAGVVYVLLQQLHVTANPDATISVDGAAFAARNGQPKRWREIGPFVWREVGGDDRLAARRVDGRVVMFGTDSTGAETVYQPAPAWRASSWNLPLFVGSVAVLLFTAVAWPVVVLVRRGFKAPYPLTGRAAWAQRLSKAAAVVAVAYVLGWAMIFQSILTDLSRMNAGLDPWLRLLQLLGLAITAGAVAGLANVWLAFSGRRPWLVRIGAALLALALLDLVWVSFAFRLITLRLDY